MSIYYVSPTGNDSTGDGSSGNPYQTIGQAESVCVNGDEIRLEKTTAATQHTAANCTWTDNSITVSTSASLTGVLSANDYIARTNTSLNGSTETVYQIKTITATTITLTTKYAGTTGTDTASIYQYTPDSTMIGSTANQPLINVEITMSGGWNLSGTPTQDGETLIKHGLAETNSSSNMVLSADIVLDKINIVGGYRCLYSSASPSLTVTNSTFGHAYIYTCHMNTTNTTNTFTNCYIVGGDTSASYGAFISTNSTTNIGNGSTYIIGMNSISADAVQTGISSYVSGFIVNNSGEAFVLGSGTQLHDCVGNNNYRDVVMSSNNNNLIKNCTFTNAGNYSIYTSTSYSLLIEDCDISNAANGIVFLTTNGVKVYNCNFDSSGTYDVNGDQYSSDIYFYNCTHTTPGTYAYNKNISGGTYFLQGCTIDAPSAAKFVNLTAGDNFLNPLYTVIGCNVLADGEYYSNGQIVKDTSVLSTGGDYTTKFSYQVALTPTTGSLVKVRSSKPVWRGYAKASTAYTIDYEVKADASWAGTITPVLTLNGVVIKTGSDITSISSGSWDAKSLSVTTGEVTADGLLALEFINNSNNYAVWIGDVTQT